MYSLAIVCVCSIFAQIVSGESSPALFQSAVSTECKKLLKDTPISNLVSDKVYTFNDPKNEYEYKLSICGSVEAGSQAAVTQRELVNDNARVVAIGRVNGTHLIQRADYLELIYYFGDKYNTHCSATHRTARIAFVCDPCGGKGTPRLVEEFTTASDSSTNGHCFYLFDWATNDACSKASNGKIIICSPTGLGPGSIFLIVLLSLGVVYIVIGVTYNRFVRRAKGREQFPNYTFWVACGDRIADGCDVCCRTRPPSIPMKHMPSVGRGDHQLDLSEDDVE